VGVGVRVRVRVGVRVRVRVRVGVRVRARVGVRVRVSSARPCRRRRGRRASSRGAIRSAPPTWG